MPNISEILIYQNPDGKISLDVRLEDETVWLTQAHMAELFQTTQQNISQHMLGVYEEGELECSSTTADFSIVHGGTKAGRIILWQNNKTHGARANGNECMKSNEAPGRLD